jgi:hypothetical protein
VSPTDGTLEAAAGGTVLRFSADDFEWAAVFLAGLECDLVVLQPPELRTSLRILAARLRDAARAPEAPWHSHPPSRPRGSRYRAVTRVDGVLLCHLNQTGVMTSFDLAAHPRIDPPAPRR